jgi:hypothetical protein
MMTLGFSCQSWTWRSQRMTESRLIGRVARLAVPHARAVTRAEAPLN